MTGRRLAAILLALVAATAVLPPAGAWAVNRRRVSRASREVSELAARLAIQPALLFRSSADDGVLRGPGRVPETAGQAAAPWLSTKTAMLAPVLPGDALTPDPWGNSYLVRVVTGAGLLVLSAGPNGLIDTPFAAPGDGASSDDITTKVTLQAIR